MLHRCAAAPPLRGCSTAARLRYLPLLHRCAAPLIISAPNVSPDSISQ